MFRFMLKLIKWFFLFWVYLLVGTVCAAIIAGIIEGLFNFSLNMDVLVCGFTLIFLIEAILKKKKKNEAKAARQTRAAASPAAPAASSGEAAGGEKKPKDEIAARLDKYRTQLERLGRNIKDRPTASQVKSIAATLNKIAREVEEDPRDRNKVRSLSEHSAAMIVDLVDKYVKLENQNQSSSNITSTMKEIRSALDTVDTSLKTLLDDLFSNDVAEVSTNIAVLENILGSSNPANRIRMEDIAKAAPETAKQDATLQPVETTASAE